MSQKSAFTAASSGMTHEHEDLDRIVGKSNILSIILLVLYYILSYIQEKIRVNKN
jgi:hypothetical protein